MLRVIALVLCAAACLMLVPAARATPTNVMAGNWSGPWAGQGQSGSVSFHITPQGVMTGTVTNNTFGITGTISGTVAANKRFVATVTYPGEGPTALNGALVQNPSTPTSATGSFIQYLPTQRFVGAFTVTAQRPHPIAGKWAGSWISGSGNRGSVNLRIAVDGSGYGMVKNTSLRLNGPIVIQVARSGHFTGTVRYNNGSTVNVGGTLRRRAGNPKTADGRFTEYDAGFPGGTFTLTR